ncbi:hypothetical protein F4805DRAFT_237284 [Annulohypoxylon moriforme]|nr:hypothetical protein F4805DRAFT_237284 [Annulohypoxylon moriforme]
MLLIHYVCVLGVLVQPIFSPRDCNTRTTKRLEFNNALLLSETFDLFRKLTYKRHLFQKLFREFRGVLHKWVSLHTRDSSLPTTNREAICTVLLRSTSRVADVSSCSFHRIASATCHVVLHRKPRSRSPPLEKAGTFESPFRGTVPICTRILSFLGLCPSFSAPSFDS